MGTVLSLGLLVVVLILCAAGDKAFANLYQEKVVKAPRSYTVTWRTR